jgi:hypothetical protein
MRLFMAAGSTVRAIKRKWGSADNTTVLRAFTFVLTIVALAASGVVLYQHMRNDGVGGVLHSLSFRQSGSQVAADVLLSAATVLEDGYKADQTYTRVDLTRFEGLVVAYAGASNYCIQVEKSGKWYHLMGPGGIPGDGTC